MRGFWKKYHKWVGLCLTFFVLMFCLSGIVLNHRKAFSRFGVSRSWLPSSYHYDNWNNGIVKGTMPLPNGKVLVYGGAGVWLTDKYMSELTPLNDGLPQGIDNRKVSNVVRAKDGKLFLSALYGVFQLQGSQWKEVPVPLDGERVSDVALRGDTMVVLSRSFVYTAKAPYTTFTRHQLPTPKDYNPKVSLFKTVWQLHSGELFGLVGRLVVDAMAVVIILLCLSGIIWFFFPGMMKRRSKHHGNTRQMGKTLAFSAKWHNRLGRYTIILTLLLAITGACLRPPLMIPLAMTSTRPLPGSTLSSDNAFHDKLRAVRWDERLQAWLLSTSMGFYSIGDFNGDTPQALKGAPTISPMGINVFEPCADGQWLIGSFSGLFLWNPAGEDYVDYLTGRKPDLSGMRAFAGGTTASGYSRDLMGKEIVFEYGRGAVAKANDATTGASQQASSAQQAAAEKPSNNQQEASSPLPEMPEQLASQPMSLWNFALELHVGRCYSPLIGPFSSLFVFLSGTLLALLLFSGWLILHRREKKHKKK